MKNLRIPTIYNAFYDRIVGAKPNGPQRTNLERLAPAVKSAYHAYLANASSNQLHNHNASSFAAANHQDLLSCYGSTAQVIKLKQHIRNRQERHIEGTCQYCMIGNSDEFDHYLPESTFPEFAVLSNNLIPVCGPCNQKKLQYWKDNLNRRAILNFYYDAIPNLSFLSCQITFRRRIPIANFSLQNNGGINANLFDLISRHFKRLGLIDRIDAKSNSEIPKIGLEIEPLVGQFTLIEAQRFLVDQSTNLRASFGTNFYLAVLKESLGNNNQFLSDVGFV